MVRIPLLLTMFGLAGAAVLSLGLPSGVAGRDLLGATALLVSPLLALAACVIASLSLPRPRSYPWQVFCAAAGLAVLAQLHRHTGAGAELDALHIFSNIGATLLFAVATGWLLRQRTSGRTLEIALDAGLVLTAGAVAVIRWGQLDWPVAANATLQGNAALLGGMLAAGSAAIAGVVLLIARSESGGRTSAAAGAATIPMATAGIALGLSVLPLAPYASTGVIATSGLPALTFVLGWLAVAYAAVRTTRPGADEVAPIGTIAPESGARLLVAPAAALLMGTVALDASMEGSLDGMTASAMTLVGVLIALRLGHLLYATRSYSSEQVELAQSLALIEVSRALSGTRQLDETLSLVARWAVRLLNGRAAVIELLMPDGETLELHAVYGLPNEMLGLTFPVEGSFTGWVVRHGRPRSTENAAHDPLLHSASVPYLGGAPLASVPLCYSSNTLGALSCIGRRPFTATDIDLLGAFADQAAVAIENARLFRQVHQLSITDPLTGLVNRRQLDRDLAREFAAARRGRRLIAVMFDLNRFKEFNDRHGHLAGDDALRLFGSALGGLMRTMNVAARYGGDEFLVLLADIDRAGAETFIERVRESFPGADADDRFRELSVCAGYAEYAPDMDRPEDLIAAADAALYLNKPSRSRRRTRT